MAGTLDIYATGTPNDGNAILHAADMDSQVFSFTPSQSGVIEEIHTAWRKLGTPASGNFWCEVWSSSSATPVSKLGQSDNVASSDVTSAWDGIVSNLGTEITHSFSTKPSIT